MLEKNEEKICSFTQRGTRIQLLKLAIQCFTTEGEYQCTNIRYEVRLNRKIIKTNESEYEMRKLFAQIVTNTVLQLKIYNYD